MRSAFIIRVLVFAALAVPAAAVDSPTGGAQDADAACTTYTQGAVVDSFGSSTFENLIEHSPLIVDATVAAVTPVAPPPGYPAAPRQDSDVTLIASRALKGSVPPGPFFVSQYAVVGEFEMRRGQRFILLLNPLSAEQRDRYYASLPSPRYSGTRLCVDGDRVYADRYTPGSRGMSGGPLADVVDTILAYTSLPRIRGRIALEAGEFPPANAPFELPPPTWKWDHRARLRFLVTRIGELTGTQPRTSAAIYLPASTVDLNSAASAGVAAAAPGEPAPRLFAIDGAGVFDLPASPGTYRLAVEGLPFGYAVRSIRFSGRDVTNGTIDVVRDAPTDLLVTLGTITTGARVSGRSSRIPEGVPLETFTVLMIPESTTGAAAGTARLRNDGTYEFTAVPPGRYTLTTMAEQAPAGTSWGISSSTTVTVSQTALTLDFPLFTGAEGRVRTRDAAGNIDPRQTAVLRFDSDNRTTVYVAVSNGEGRFWLPPGDFYATVSQTGGYTRVVSNGDSVFITPIRSDGMTPLPPIDVFVERGR